MYSTINQTKTHDKYAPSSIRGDMMKLQQQIHRIHCQYDQVSQLIPPNLPNDLPTLMSQMQILSARVDAETKFNYSKEINSLEKKINELRQKLTVHENVTKDLKNANGEYNENSLTDLEKKIIESNNLFLDNVHAKINQRLEKYVVQKNNNANSNEQKTIDLHLSANFSSNSETEAGNSSEKNIQIVQIETASTLDPAIHQRVRRHSDRIQLVEDDFDRLLAKKVPEILPQKQLQNIFSDSEMNKKQIEDLEKKYCELESTLRDIKQEKQALIEKKKKMEEASHVPGAVTFSEFTDFKNKLFNEFNSLSIEITSAENEINDSISDLREHLNSIDRKINDFKQSASDFDSLIKLSDKRIYNVEVKILKKSEQISLSDNAKDKLISITKNGEKKIDQLSQEIKSKIEEVKLLVSELKDENQLNTNADHSIDSHNENKEKSPKSSQSKKLELPPTNPPDES